MTHSGSAPQRELKASLCNIVRIHLETESHRRARALLQHGQWPGFRSQYCQKQTNNKNQKESKPNETFRADVGFPQTSQPSKYKWVKYKSETLTTIKFRGGCDKMFGCSCQGNLRLQHHRCFHFSPSLKTQGWQESQSFQKFSEVTGKQAPHSS